MPGQGFLGAWDLPKRDKTRIQVHVKAPVIGNTIKVSWQEGKVNHAVGGLAVPSVRQTAQEFAFSIYPEDVVVRATYAGRRSRVGFNVDVFLDGVSLRDGTTLEEARRGPDVPLWDEDRPGRPTLGLRRRCWIFLASERPVIVLLGAIAVAVLWSIPAGRMERSASAPAVLDEVGYQSDGRAFVLRFSFSVGGTTYHCRDVYGEQPGKGDRTWDPGELATMHVCYDPTRPGKEYALTPAHYRCGDPDIITTDGGW